MSASIVRQGLWKFSVLARLTGCPVPRIYLSSSDNAGVTGVDTHTVFVIFIIDHFDSLSPNHNYQGHLEACVIRAPPVTVTFPLQHATESPVASNSGGSRIIPAFSMILYSKFLKDSFPIDKEK